MDASEFKKLIFRMLFLKRLSAELDLAAEKVTATFAHLPPDMQQELPDAPSAYKPFTTLYMPTRAKWKPTMGNEVIKKRPPFRDSLKPFFT